MTKLMNWLEPSIHKQVDKVADTVEKDERVVVLLEQYADVYTILQNALESEEHKSLLREIDGIFSGVQAMAEYIAYRTGLLDGITMQQEINVLCNH